MRANAWARAAMLRQAASGSIAAGWARREISRWTIFCRKGLKPQQTLEQTETPLFFSLDPTGTLPLVSPVLFSLPSVNRYYSDFHTTAEDGPMTQEKGAKAPQDHMSGYARPVGSGIAGHLGARITRPNLTSITAGQARMSMSTSSGASIQQAYRNRLDLLRGPGTISWRTPNYRRPAILIARHIHFSRAASEPAHASAQKQIDSYDESPEATKLAADTAEQRLVFQVSASYSAKAKRFEPNMNTFTYNPYNKVSPTRNNRPETGQDAFFISRINESAGIALGVADGVGGYARYGVDSADFAHTLCENMSSLAHAAPTAELHPRDLLENAYERLVKERSVVGGASTACVGTVRPNGRMMVANVGDSGYIILRHGKVVYISPAQTHQFNTPYQLAVIPPEELEQSRLFQTKFLCDLPRDANITTHFLERGDVVLFATDGVWDNLFPSDILRIVSKEMLAGHGWSNGMPLDDASAKSTEAENAGHLSSSSSSDSSDKQDTTLGKGIAPTPHLAKATEKLDGTGLQTAVARAIAGHAKSMSLNRRVDGPFGKLLKQTQPWERWSGGKKDDICVVCLVVV